MNTTFRGTTVESCAAAATAQYSRAAGLGRATHVWITHDVQRPADADQRGGGGVTMRAATGVRRLAAGAAAALALVVSTGPTLDAAAAPIAPTGAVRFLDHAGPVLPAVQLDLIYWGRGWTTTPVPSPPPQVTAAVQTMLAGPYLTGLAQYRGVGRGVLRGSSVITMSDPPQRFTNGQVRRFLNGQLDAGTVPGPDADNQTVYGVLMPNGITSRGNGFDGEHDYYTRRGRRIHYMWIAASASLANVTRVLSHEIVESATDPELDGFRGVAGACSQSGPCEIADVCPATSVLDGVTVTSYWSNHAGRCVAPVPPDPRPAQRRRGIDGSAAAPAAYRRPTIHPVAVSAHQAAPARTETSAEPIIIPAMPSDSRHGLTGRRDDEQALRSDAESRPPPCGFGIAYVVDRWVAEQQTWRTH